MSVAAPARLSVDGAGFSQGPEEYAEPEHIATGVEVLAHTLARLAA